VGSFKTRVVKFDCPFFVPRALSFRGVTGLRCLPRFRPFLCRSAPPFLHKGIHLSSTGCSASTLGRWGLIRIKTSSPIRLRRRACFSLLSRTRLFFFSSFFTLLSALYFSVLCCPLPGGLVPARLREQIPRIVLPRPHRVCLRTSSYIPPSPPLAPDFSSGSPALYAPCSSSFTFREVASCFGIASALENSSFRVLRTARDRSGPRLLFVELHLGVLRRGAGLHACRSGCLYLK